MSRELSLPTRACSAVALRNGFGYVESVATSYVVLDGKPQLQMVITGETDLGIETITIEVPADIMEHAEADRVEMFTHVITYAMANRDPFHIDDFDDEADLNAVDMDRMD